MSERVKVDWRAPRDCRDWLAGQPGGMSATLERLVRGAMNGLGPDEALAFRERLDELRRNPPAIAPSAPQNGAQSVTEASAKDGDWGDWNDA